MKKLKILIYDTNFAKHITRDILIMKLKYWQKNNCDITILCTKEGEKYYKTILENITFITLNYTYKLKSIYLLPWEFAQVTFYALFHLNSIINKFDIIYSQSSVIDFVFVPWIAKLLDKKMRWYVLVENIVPPPHKRPGPFLRNLIPYIAFLIVDQLLRSSNGLFVASIPLYDYYKTRKYNVVSIGEHYGIDQDIFKGAVSKSSPRFDAVYCGRLHEAKGVFDLVEVVREVVRVKNDFTLGIMGEGGESLKKRLKEKIISYGLVKNIVFNGYVKGKRKGDILRKAGFFLFLSYDEAGSHAVLEAIAINKIVVSYDLPVYHSVYKENIKNEQMVFFRLGQFKKIADFIISLGNKKFKFSNNIEDYKWDTILKNELNIMRDLLAEKSK